MTALPDSTLPNIATLRADRDQKRARYEALLNDQFTHTDDLQNAWVAWLLASDRLKWAEWIPDEHVVKPK